MQPCSFVTFLTSIPLRNLDADLALFVPSRLVLRLLITSADVLHS